MALVEFRNLQILCYDNGIMAKNSKLLKCPYCEREIHARGWMNHLFFQHSVPMQEARQYLKVGRRDRRKYEAQNNNISAELQQVNTRVEKLEDFYAQLNHQIPMRSESAKSDEVKGSLTPSSSATPAKPTKTNWKQVAWIGGVVVLAYYTIPELRDLLQRHWRGETYDRRKLRV